MSQQDIIFPTLAAMYPDPTTELHYTTPFQLLIAVMMSAQATDKQVNKVTKSLFGAVKTPHDVIAMGEKAYNQNISSIGLHNSKSRHIYATSQLLIDLHTKSIARVAPFFETAVRIYPTAPSINDLTSLPGVGIKTAKVVLQVLYGLPHIAVDTHVHRVSNRLGFVSTNTPEQTDKILESVIQNKYLHIAHHTLILFGRYHCTARNPKCSTCPLFSVCQRENKSLYC
jgi:endonuclease III